MSKHIHKSLSDWTELFEAFGYIVLFPVFLAIKAYFMIVKNGEKYVTTKKLLEILRVQVYGSIC